MCQSYSGRTVPRHFYLLIVQKQNIQFYITVFQNTQSVPFYDTIGYPGDAKCLSVSRHLIAQYSHQGMGIFVVDGFNTLLGKICL